MVNTPRDLPEGGIRLPMPEGELRTYQGREKPVLPVPPSDDAIDGLQILKRWLGGKVSPDIVRHVVDSGMFETDETRHTMREATPPGGMEAWEGRMPTAEDARPPDTLIYEGKGYPGQLEQASMEIPNPAIEEGLSRLERFIQGLLPGLFSPSGPGGAPPRPSPQAEPEGAQAQTPSGNGGLRDLTVPTPDTHLAPGVGDELREQETWLTPRSRENSRAARRTMMRVDRTPPAGPFAKTDDATLRALSQSLEGTLREEVLKELELRAQNGGAQDIPN